MFSSQSNDFMPVQRKQYAPADKHTYCRQSTKGQDNLRQGTAELFLGHI